MKIGDEIISSDNCEIKVGNSMKLKDIPLGTNIHCVELSNEGSSNCKKRRTSARLVAKEGIYITLRLQSGETRKVLWECRATLGTVPIKKIIFSLLEKLVLKDGGCQTNC